MMLLRVTPGKIVPCIAGVERTLPWKKKIVNFSKKKNFKTHDINRPNIPRHRTYMIHPSIKDETE